MRKLQPDTKTFLILGIAVGLLMFALLFDIFIIKLMFDDATLWRFSYSALILEIIATGLIGWAVYVRFPNPITKMFPFISMGLASGILLLEWKQQWYKMDYNYMFMFFIILHSTFMIGFTFLSVMEKKNIEAEFITLGDAQVSQP